MTSSHSSSVDSPRLVWIACDACNRYYEELSAVAWGRRSGLIKRLLCIRCDPVALRRVSQDFTTTRE